MITRNYRIALIVGVASSVFWFFVLQHLSLLSNDAFVAAVVAMPFLFLATVTLVYRFPLSHLLHKIAKFMMVGVLNTGIDFFIFNTLIIFTGLDTGVPITLFKSFSFLCALFNSYELNRLWTFDDEAAPSRTGREFGRFAMVTLIGFFINVGTTSGIVATVHPLFGLSQIRWDNVAAIIATALNLAWNFVGYKIFVFGSKGQIVTVAPFDVV
jgi:putative flippase GtrA